MSLSKLIEKVKVHDPVGRVFDQCVVYEWRPGYYHKCCQLGRVCMDKPPSPRDKPTRGAIKG